MRRRLRVGLVVLSMLAMVFSVVPMLNGSGAEAAGVPLYPDLQTPAPSDLSFDSRPIPGHYVLRLSNRIVNMGGPLEIRADPDASGGGYSRAMHQKVYDAYDGGQVAQSIPLGTDLLYHSAHGHFHVPDVASYELLAKTDTGEYESTGLTGSKNSFCLLDVKQITMVGTGATKYYRCANDVQGISPGWADLYQASLPDQWIDLGTSILADGEYAVRAVADPDNLLRESNDENNVGTTFFTVAGGQIVPGTFSTSIACSAEPEIAMPGQLATITCIGMPAGKQASLYWDQMSNGLIKTVGISPAGIMSTSFTVPIALAGVHPIFVIANDEDETMGSAIVRVDGRLTLSAERIKPGASFNVQMDGFGGFEQVTLTMADGTRLLTLGSVWTDKDGSASRAITMPNATNGRHYVAATGAVSRLSVQVPIRVLQSLTVTSNRAVPGGSVRVILKGYGGGENVEIRLNGTLLGTIRVGGSGAMGNALLGTLGMPITTPFGRWTLSATGTTTGAVSRLTMSIVSGPTPTPTRTATRTATPTMTSTTSPTSTVVPSPTATSTSTQLPTGTATIEPAGTKTVVASATPTVEPTETNPVDGPLTATPVETATEIASATVGPVDTATAIP